MFVNIFAAPCMKENFQTSKIPLDFCVIVLRVFGLDLRAIDPVKIVTRDRFGMIVKLLEYTRALLSLE